MIGCAEAVEQDRYQVECYSGSYWSGVGTQHLTAESAMAELRRLQQSRLGADKPDHIHTAYRIVKVRKTITVIETELPGVE